MCIAHVHTRHAACMCARAGACASSFCLVWPSPKGLTMQNVLAVRVVLYDSDERKRTPMFHFLLSAGLVDSVSLFAAGEGANLLGSARKGVDAAQQAREWQQQGIVMAPAPL